MLLIIGLSGTPSLCGVPRVKSVVEEVVNDFVLFQVLKVICDFLLRVVCGVPPQGFIGGVITQLCYFSVIKITTV